MPASSLLVEIKEVTLLPHDRHDKRGELRCINGGPGGGGGTNHRKLPCCATSHISGSPVQHGQTSSAAAAGHGGAGWGAVDRGPGSTLRSEALRP